MVAIAQGTVGGGARPTKFGEAVGMKCVRSTATGLVGYDFTIFGSGKERGRGQGETDRPNGIQGGDGGPVWGEIPQNSLTQFS